MYYTLLLYDIPATRTGAGHNINRPTTDVQHHLLPCIYSDTSKGGTVAYRQLLNLQITEMFVTVLKLKIDNNRVFLTEGS